MVLADQFVRYALLAWNPALKSEEQWLALARHRLGSVHGAPAADWDVKLTETAPGGPARLRGGPRAPGRADGEARGRERAPRVGAALPGRCLQPAEERLLRSLGRGSCWLVVEEPRRLTLAFIQHGVWVAVRSRRADPAGAAPCPSSSSAKAPSSRSPSRARASSSRPGRIRPGHARGFPYRGGGLRRAGARLERGMKKLGLDFVRRPRSPWPGRVLLVLALGSRSRRRFPTDRATPWP